MLTLPIPPMVEAAIAPLEQLKGTVENILEVVKDKSLSDPALKDVRREKMMGLINERFDFVEMSMMTLGKNWKILSQEEKDEFQGLFANLLQNNYIGRIESYSDELIVYDKEVFAGEQNSRARVYTNILKNGHEIPINYSMVKKGEDWFVYDVVIEGVSLVRNYRTEFGRILNKENFAGLIKRMQEKIVANEAERNK